MRIDFVHCWACRLPSSPSGRRVWVDGMEVRGDGVARTCALVSAMRAQAASSAPRVPVTMAPREYEALGGGAA